tara:strand:+ start:993 stop:1205 length:213 start_codon:yes stop_codon:yes gene_type:complete
MIHTTYNVNLNGSVCTEEQAIEWANGIVWGEMQDPEDERITHGTYITTVQGTIGVWYDYCGDYYFFTEES